MDWDKYARYGGMASGIGQMLGGIFGPRNGGRKIADAANQYYNQIPGEIGKYYDPYINEGRGAYDEMSERYRGLMDDPSKVLGDIGSKYQESPGYKWALQQALQAGGNAAAAGGMAGTPMHQQESMETAQGMASKDFENYLNHALGLYGAGLEGGQGIASDKYGKGYGASQSMADAIASMRAQQAQMAAGAEGMNQRQKAGNWSNIFQGAASALPWMFL